MEHSFASVFPIPHPVWTEVGAHSLRCVTLCASASNSITLPAQRRGEQRGGEEVCTCHPSLSREPAGAIHILHHTHHTSSAHAILPPQLEYAHTTPAIPISTLQSLDPKTTSSLSFLRNWDKNAGYERSRTKRKAASHRLRTVIRRLFSTNSTDPTSIINKDRRLSFLCN